MILFTILKQIEMVRFITKCVLFLFVCFLGVCLVVGFLNYFYMFVRLGFCWLVVFVVV